MILRPPARPFKACKPSYASPSGRDASGSVLAHAQADVDTVGPRLRLGGAVGMLGARRRTRLQFLAGHAADGAAGDVVGGGIFGGGVGLARIAEKDGVGARWGARHGQLI
jgi:hypothetical protein